MHACDAYIHVVLAIAGSATGEIVGSHLVNILSKLCPSGFQVLHVQLYIAPFLQTFIGHRSPTAINLHRVGQEVAVHLHRGIDETVSGSQQHDDHKDAPRHSKSRERSTKFIPSRCLPYFSYYIVHNLYSFATDYRTLRFFLSH